MPRLVRPSLLSLLALTALLVAVPVATAQAAERTVPFGFFGTVLNPDIASPNAVSDLELANQTELMARNGVESLRMPMPWQAIEPARGVYNFRYSDRLVRAAARSRINVLANVQTTPRWASDRPTSDRYYLYQPQDPADFANFMTALIGRYGPRGTFWAENPTIPRTPVRQWQIWNEQRARVFWASQPWARTYTRLLRAAYPAIHRADRGAKVIAGSLVALGSVSTQWGQARQMYRAGARRFFDVVAVHPFTDASVGTRESVRRVIEIARRVRDEMRKGGDARKPMILTEVSWPAAIPGVPRNRRLGLETTERGQKALLAAAYRRLANDRRRLRITQAYWYTWATQYNDNSPQSDVSYRFSGLTRFDDGSFSRMPILSTYARVAARYQGCRKGADARSCRR